MTQVSGHLGRVIENEPLRPGHLLETAFLGLFRKHTNGLQRKLGV